MVSTWKNYARNDNCSPCRRKYSAILNKETHISVLQLRKYKESSMGRLWRKHLTLTHKECVHYFSCEKGGNSPKWAVCFFHSSLANPLGNRIGGVPRGLRSCRCFAFWMLQLVLAFLHALGSRVQ